jgi:N-acyl-D-amino-acid deacylase
MPEYDLVIRGGTIIDGLRTPRFRGDLAVKDGKISAIGRVAAGSGEKEIDASGLIVAPGFIDMHTHYDSQIFWDPYCTLSGWHGVTSVVVGNCGFAFAPVAPENRERAMLTMARNEAVPMESMREGMPWDWETYPEFLESLDRTPKGVNVLGYVGMNPIMTYVMGFESKGRAATPEELDRMCRLLEEGLEAGGCGFSVQLMGEDSPQRDHDGTPMITDTMAERDLMAFAQTLGRAGRGFIQMIGSLDMAERLAEESGRPVIWNLLAVEADQHGAPMMDHLEAIRRIDELNKVKGIRVFAQAMTVDMNLEFTFEDWNLFDRSPLWREATLGNVEERTVKLSDPEGRKALREEYDEGRAPTLGHEVKSTIGDLKLEWIHSRDPELKKFEGLTVQEIADATGKHVIDAMLDVAVADELKAGFGTPPGDTNVEAMRQVANSDYALPGVSDGGAHTKFITHGSYTTQFLTKWVRDKQIMDLEQAHWRLSAYPAIASGFKDRGWLKEGSPADVVIYDLESLEVLSSERTYDFPAGAWRLTQKASGYRYTIVNGEITFIDGESTGATPGRLLRHGRD